MNTYTYELEAIVLHINSYTTWSFHLLDDCTIYANWQETKTSMLLLSEFQFCVDKVGLPSGPISFKLLNPSWVASQVDY